MKESKINWVQAFVGLLIGVVLGVGGMTLTNQTRPAAIVIEPPAPTEEAGPEPTPMPISVYVNGEVFAPGVYDLSADARVTDAIEAAGGLTDSAYEDAVNLAFPLFDGAQIFVASEEQVAANEEQVIVTLANVTGGGSAISGSSSGDGGVEGGLVNINSADRTALETVPGVGPSTAESILLYREDSGIFCQIEDIMNVTGIGEGKFDNMRESITVGDEALGSPCN